MSEAFENRRLAAAFVGSPRDFQAPSGADLLGRVESFFNRQNLRRDNGVLPPFRATPTAPDTAGHAGNDGVDGIASINFAAQDYLGLSAHDAIKQVAKEVVERYGVHGAGLPTLVGRTSPSIALERKIAAFLEMEEAVLFPSGWAAGFGVIKGLVRPADHVVLDNLSHGSLQEGAKAVTRNIHRFRHLDAEHCRRRLAKIRAKDTTNGIMVVTEGLFSMESDAPDLAAMQEICNEFDATLVVNVAHDLGCLGEDGRGQIGIQKMLGKIDIVIGSFSKTFASNGGFVACRNRAVKEYLRFTTGPATLSNALSAVQAAVVLKAFEIVQSNEGRALRSALMHNALSLRRRLRTACVDYHGDPSAIVCIKIGSEGMARLVGRNLAEFGLVADPVEFPAVPRGTARIRMQVTAGHSEQDIAGAVQRLARGLRAATFEFDAQKWPGVDRAVA